MLRNTSDLGCGGTENLCFEPVGDDVTETWVWKGEGRGAFRDIAEYQFVGWNQGNYDKETLLRPNGMRCRRCCYVVLCLSILGLFVLLLVLFLAQPSGGYFADDRVELAVPATTSLAFDCKAGFWNWNKGWSGAKKSWCCAHANRGCAATTPSEPFDCDAALGNWRAAWSDAKKDWCCDHYSKGCSDLTTAIPYRCSFGNPRAWGVSKRAWCCDHRSIGCDPPTTSLPYDCQAGLANWKAGWSPGKQIWCCNKLNLGCKPKEPHDCQKNQVNWQIDWSMQKKAYCCQHHNRGCTTTSSLPYDCDAGYINWQAGWSSSKQRWCCVHSNTGCVTTTSLPYDCEAGFVNWQNGWSRHKKIWCCNQFNTGCSTTTPVSSLPYDCNAGYANWRAGWSFMKKAWCCHRFGRACPDTTTSLPYDCDAGFSNWEVGWSSSKKRWCCTHENRACAQYDCKEGFGNWKTVWGEAKRAWCCNNGNEGCTTSLPFDCTAGISNWQHGWSQAKKVWCCHSGRARCVSAAQGTCVLWGDPHIKSFDHSRLVFYSEGDFWIVRSPAIKIQGRFQATDWTKKNDHTDYSSMTSVIVSGSFMNGGGKIQVDSMLGSISCNGRQILQQFGQTSCGGGRISFGSNGALVDQAMAYLPHKVVHMDLPQGVHVQVNRWPNFINAKIQMSGQVGQDGVCGNFNGNAADDMGKELHQRFGHGIPQGELLFSNAIPWHSPHKMPNSRRCSPEKLHRASAICRQAESESGWSYAECLGDVCDAHIHGKV